ncbi:hypothetical protein DSOL_0162 [Desulfosporosinus metallidurans]|uniref:Uncharacterized protein n=1 Tax=Desulfosporosinus metallidurans TaxID=1888891 RepID=A0A1Q8R321_9FIRM|nr:hypothetical protein DSOL_0162 [Desulfosporosinus metallidurans]
MLFYGEFKGGGFVDSGPYPLRTCNLCLIHSQESLYAFRHQIPFYKGGK